MTESVTMDPEEFKVGLGHRVIVSVADTSESLFPDGCKISFFRETNGERRVVVQLRNRATGNKLGRAFLAGWKQVSTTHANADGAENKDLPLFRATHPERATLSGGVVTLIMPKNMEQPIIKETMRERILSEMAARGQKHIPSKSVRSERQRALRKTEVVETAKVAPPAETTGKTPAPAQEAVGTSVTPPVAMNTGAVGGIVKVGAATGARAPTPQAAIPEIGVREAVQVLNQWKEVLGGNLTLEVGASGKLTAMAIYGG